MSRPRVAEHGGTTDGARAHLAIYRDDDLVVAILTNQRTSIATKLAHPTPTLASQVARIEPFPREVERCDVVPAIVEQRADHATFIRRSGASAGAVSDEAMQAVAMSMSTMAAARACDAPLPMRFTVAASRKVRLRSRATETRAPSPR